jgi:hypothetical protein
MSENPNPTRCGNCGTENPPGEDFCINCHAPLTLAADPGVLDDTPEAADEARHLEGGDDADPPGGVVLAGMGGAPIPVPGETLDPEADVPPRD